MHKGIQQSDLLNSLTEANTKLDEMKGWQKESYSLQLAIFSGLKWIYFTIVAYIVYIEFFK
ncbi:hypothetical protein HOB87_09185 [Candidatus Woesearchaeota archaeon]|jgi:hypothetical protein|nr:hypothetical protein [Candidatus Woesearchaeota archaeon]